MCMHNIKETNDKRKRRDPQDRKKAHWQSSGCTPSPAKEEQESGGGQFAHHIGGSICCLLPSIVVVFKTHNHTRHCRHCCYQGLQNVHK